MPAHPLTIQPKHHAQGNVLFLILIAVALFGALAYAVTQSSRSSGEGVGKDKDKLVAAQVIQYATTIEQSVLRILLINKAQDYAMDMSDSGGISRSTANSACAVDNCKLFHTTGGVIPAEYLPDRAWDKDNAFMMSTIEGRITFAVLAVDEVGSPLPELVFAYIGLNKEVCAEINTKLDIANNADGTPPTDSAGTFNTNYVLYSGNLTAFPTTTGISIGNEAAQLKGKRSFCAFDPTLSNSYTFYHVLLSR